MKQITVYGLLSKIYNYNGNIPMPKKIKYDNKVFKFCDDVFDYADGNSYLFKDYFVNIDNNKDFLQDTVDILDDEIETISSKTRYYFSSISNGMMRTDREALDSMFDTIYKKIDELSNVINEMKKGE